GVAIRVRRSVAAFQPKLVCTQPVELDKEIFIEFHSAVLAGLDFYHPTLYAFGKELLVPWGVERVGEIDALAVAADLDHLRATVERLPGLLRVSGPAHDAAEVERAGLFWVGGIGDVVPDELACAPARDVEEAVVE